MTKIVINRCFGGFGLSAEAKAELQKTGEDLGQYDMRRDDPRLVAVVEALGPNANGEFANLQVIEVPGDVEWEIDEYDGLESIHEKHRSWP